MMCWLVIPNYCSSLKRLQALEDPHFKKINVRLLRYFGNYGNRQAVQHRQYQGPLKFILTKIKLYRGYITMSQDSSMSNVLNCMAGVRFLVKAVIFYPS